MKIAVLLTAGLAVVAVVLAAVALATSGSSPGNGLNGGGGNHARTCDYTTNLAGLPGTDPRCAGVWMSRAELRSL